MSNVNKLFVVDPIDERENAVLGRFSVCEDKIVCVPPIPHLYVNSGCIGIVLGGQIEEFKAVGDHELVFLNSQIGWLFANEIKIIDG